MEAGPLPDTPLPPLKGQVPPEQLMTTHFPISCDQCDTLMYLRWQISRNQSYECPVCPDRWAIVWINSSGGINTVRFTNRKDAKGNHQAIALGGIAGTLFDALFRRKRD